MDWQTYRASYAKALQSREALKNKTGLVDLDHFLWHELPEALSQRKEQYITKAEYSKIVSWKLKRGKWRPRLQKFADEIPDGDIIQASRASFSSLANSKFRQALEELTSLKGCGAATASAILAAGNENMPFMSDEILLETQNQQKKYTIPAYLELMHTVQAKATQLSDGDGAQRWTARQVEQAVFAAHHQASIRTSPVAHSSTADESKARPKPKLEMPRTVKRQRTSARPSMNSGGNRNVEANKDAVRMRGAIVQQGSEGMVGETDVEKRVLRRSPRNKTEKGKI